MLEKTATSGSPTAEGVDGSAYARPAMVPIGNLKDLLRGNSGTLCDAVGDLPNNVTQTGSNCGL
jgi:hypothetical protein